MKYNLDDDPIFQRIMKNYIHNIYNIENISTCINNNKLSLLGRLMKHDSTRTVLLSSAYLQHHSSFFDEVFNVAKKEEINIYDVILNNNPMEKLSTSHGWIDPIKKTMVEDCLKFWNIAEKRKQFISILEERVERNHDNA